MLSKFAHHVRRNRRAAARIFSAGDLQYPDSGGAELRAYGTIKCSVTDPEDGISLHWDQGSLTKSQLERFVPQCDQLCERCLQLADDLAKDLSQRNPHNDTRFSYSHHETLRTLKSAAIAGCHFCTLICSGGSHTESSDHSGSIAYLLEIEIKYYKSEGYYGNTYVATDDGPYSVGIQLSSGFPRQAIPMTKRFPSTGYPKVLDLARVWLEGCMTTHGQCCLPTMPAHHSWSPTRLLQISASDSGIKNIRVTLCPNLLESKGYLTLSHRWGGADVVKLTKDTLDPFMIEIPQERLPKNFFDAILVTVHLGFEFLWIDSLCIIQDSKTDWQQESVNMGRIYRHSQCTIAAVDAQDSHEGLFRERNELESTFCQLLGSQQGSHNLLWAQQSHQLGQRPLYQRAWVMQEQCLSRRILEFGNNQISWECISGSTWERGDPSLENTELRRINFLNLNRQAERMLTIMDDQEPIGNFNALPHDFFFKYSGHWIQDWWDLVEQYTERDLTYVTDRAAAISGIIDLISEARRVPFVYGTWIPYLVSDLLWCVSVPAEGRVAIEYPSWSWFSVNTGIKYKLQSIWESELLDHGAATVSIDETASLEHADILNKVLKITAQMLEVHQFGPLPAMHTGVRAETPTRTRYVFRLHDGRDQKQDGERLEDLEEAWDGEWFPDTTFDTKWKLEAIQFTETVHRRSSYETIPYKTTQWYRQRTGLMVVSVDGEARVYRRVGWYSIQWDIEKGKHRYKTFYKRANLWKKHMWERRLGERQTIWLV